jgi:hypothetical protein
MLWMIIGGVGVFYLGALFGVVITALSEESHVCDEAERAYALGQAHGERAAEKLIPFPRSSGPKAAA